MMYIMQHKAIVPYSDPIIHSWEYETVTDLWKCNDFQVRYRLPVPDSCNKVPESFKEFMKRIDSGEIFTLGCNIFTVFKKKDKVMKNVVITKEKYLKLVDEYENAKEEDKKQLYTGYEIKNRNLNDDGIWSIDKITDLEGSDRLGFRRKWINCKGSITRLIKFREMTMNLFIDGDGDGLELGAWFRTNKVLSYKFNKEKNKLQVITKSESVYHLSLVSKEYLLNWFNHMCEVARCPGEQYKNEIFNKLGLEREK